jgi:two-component sensor histidine kinase
MEFGSYVRPEVRSSLARCEAHIVALGRLHRMLAVGSKSRPTAVRAYVEELCRSLSEAVLTPLGVGCEVSLDDEFLDELLPSGMCERLGLIIAELVTNAAKHAFAGRDDGLVRIEIIRNDGRWLCSVSDNGGGIGSLLVGCGTSILDDIAYMIGGTLILRTGVGGTSVTIAF